MLEPHPHRQWGGGVTLQRGTVAYTLTIGPHVHDAPARDGLYQFIICLSVALFLFLFLSLSLSLSFSPSLPLSFSLNLSLCLSVSLCVCLSVSIFLCLSASLCYSPGGCGCLPALLQSGVDVEVAQHRGVVRGIRRLGRPRHLDGAAAPAEDLGGGGGWTAATQPVQAGKGAPPTEIK